MKETFEAMLKHMAWADRRIGAALAESGDGAPSGGAADADGAQAGGVQAAGAKERGTDGAGTEADALHAEAVRLYAHIVSAETIWISRLTGNENLPVPVFPDWDLAEARARSEETLAKYERFLAADPDFRRIVEYKTSGGVPHRTAAADILTHVFLHGSHHRGQINARLRGAGRTPPNVDYITFAR